MSKIFLKNVCHKTKMKGYRKHNFTLQYVLRFWNLKIAVLRTHKTKTSKLFTFNYKKL